MSSVGILAYGSLISHPDAEIEAACIDIRTGITTPFHVESARSSRSRGGAPTLVPVHSGGMAVTGQIFVLDMPEEDAVHALYRREINKVGSGCRYSPPREVHENTVQVKSLKNFAGLDVVLYTDIAANIEPLTPQELARRALESVRIVSPGRDGISYLIAARKHGIRTALSDDYEMEILRRSGDGSLEDALQRTLGPGR